MQNLAIPLNRFAAKTVFAIALVWLNTSLNAVLHATQAKSEVESCIIKTAKPKKYYSTEAVLRDFGKPVREKLTKIFATSSVQYPPKEMTWVCLKAEKELKLFAKDKNGKYQKVLQYPIIGASGKAGPKLKEGDMQVPEGFYRLSGFRPNLVAHMGLDVSYPNAEDRAHAGDEHRKNLGYDILIHGSRWSTGCLAMGNEPIEEMFVLAHDVGLKNIALIFAPCDLTKTKPDIDMNAQPKWLPELYLRLKKALTDYTD